MNSGLGWRQTADADETLEVDSPDHIPGLHEIEGRKWNSDGRGPALLRNARFGGPNGIPAGITVSLIALRPLLFGY